MARSRRTAGHLPNPPTRSDAVPGFSVLEVQVALIQRQARRLQRLLLREDRSSGHYAPEVSAAIALQRTLCESLLRTHRNPKNAPADGAWHQTPYAFLTPDEEQAFLEAERKFRAVEGQIERGEATMSDYYRAAGPLFKLEQVQAVRMGEHR